MKEGLICEDGMLFYYKNNERYHAGVIQVDDAIYYIDSHGCAVKGQYIVHGVMTNGILKRGTYTFGDDYKLVKGSYIAPKKRKHRRKKMQRKYRLLTAVVAVTLILLTVAVSQAFDPPESVRQDLPQQSSIVLPNPGNDVLLCSPMAKQVYDGQADISSAVQTGNPYRPFLFEYQLNDASGILLLSENIEFVGAREYELDNTKNVLSIDNLKTDTVYYFKVIVDKQEYSGTFKTAPSTRFISISSLTNLRDIGGYTTLDGRLVKQGVLIRGVELDGLVNPEYLLSDSDAELMQNTFSFVYDFDLREPSLYTGTYISPLGENVGHKFYGSPQYGQIFAESFHPQLRAIFADLADPEKYPMYLHCTWGTDRTGTIIFLLQGILNMSEEDMIREYRLTSFVNPSIVDNSNMEIISRGLNPYEGNNLQEKIVTYLTTVVGVTLEEIETIRNIYLE